MKNFFPGLLTIVALFISTTIFAQVTGEYRSRATGDWNDHNTWEQWDGSEWIREIPDTSFVPGEVEIEIDQPVIESTATYQSNSTSGSTRDVTLPSGIQAGDLLLMVFRAGNTTTATTPAGWNLLSSRSNSGTTYVWTKTATGSEGSTQSVTISTGTRVAAITYRISNWQGTPEISFANSNTSDPPSLSPSWGTNNTTLFIATMTNRRSNNTNVGAPSNYDGFLTIAQSSNNNDSRSRVSTAHRYLTASSENPGSFSGSSGNNPHAATIAIQGQATTLTVNHPVVAGTATSAKTSDNNQNHNISIPDGETGDMILVFWSGANSSFNPNTTMTNTHGFTTVYNEANNGDRRRALWYKIADGTEGSSISVGSNSVRSAHLVYRLAAGTFTGTPYISDVVSNNDDDNPNPPSLDPGLGVQNFLWLAAIHTDGAPGVTGAPNEYPYQLITTSGSSSTSSNHAGMIVGQRFLAAASEDPGQFSLHDDVSYYARTIAIQGPMEMVINYTPISYPQGVESFPVVAGTATSIHEYSNSVHTIELPSGIESGDLLLIFWTDGSQNSTAPNMPAGWTQLYSSTSGNTARYVWYRVADGTEGSSVSTLNSFQERSAHVAYRIAKNTYEGIPSSAAIATGSSTNPNPPQHTPPGGANSYLWIAVAHAASLSSTTAPSGAPTNYADLQSAFSDGTGGNNGVRTFTASRELETANEDPGNFAWSLSTSWAANTIAIQGAVVEAIATILDGDTVTVTENVEMFDVTIEAGGELAIEENTTFIIIEGGVLENNAGGTISGTGTLDFSGADFTNNGTLSPGFSTGILNITGTFQNDGEIDIEITGAPAGGAGVAFDQLNISGKAIINDTINVDFGDYIPLPGYEYQIIFGGEDYEGTPALNIVPNTISANYDAGKLIVVSVIPANIEKVWDRGANTDNWEDSENWLPDGVPGPGDDIWIGYFPDIDATVVLSTETEIESMILGSDLRNAQLTIIDGAGLTTNGKGWGDDGIHLWENSSSVLIVEGDLNVGFEDLDGGDGIDINAGTTMIIGETGVVNIDVIGNDALEISGKLRNSGVINIDQAVQRAINIQGSAPDSAFINYSTGQVLSLGANNPGIFLASGGGLIRYINEGTTILTTNATNNVTGSGLFHNYGTFGGEGVYESAQSFINFAGAVIAPGTSPGILTLNHNGTLNLAGAIFNMEIEGNGDPGVDYDQVVVNAPALDITGATLNVSGSYEPQVGDEFVLLTYSGTLEGEFVGMAEHEEFLYKGFPFIISYVGGQIVMMNMAVLPVELIEFNARPLANEVLLNWTTASEINNDYFTVERSADGRNFEAIATVYGNGTTTEITKYQHADKSPLNGLSYYRLKQTDFDGAFSYSAIKSVEFKNSNSVKVYPTLVENAVTIETNGNFSGEITVIVRDITGKEHRSFVISSKSNKEEIALYDLVPGSYFIVVYDNANVYTQKVMKF